MSGLLHMQALAALLPSAVVEAEPAGKGGNSRVLRVRCEDGSRYLAKFYFQPTVTGGDRLQAEFSALSFLTTHGVTCVPRPVACDRVNQIGVYELIEAQKISAARASTGDIEQCVRFAALLKRLSRLAESNELPPAAEACFSVEELSANIAARASRLRERSSCADLLAFLSGEFMPAFASLTVWARDQLGPNGGARVLPHADRTLSPSDFGFHNALKQADGNLVFVDFEYFGWDDPAKMIADFILHPAMNLSTDLKSLFVRRMTMELDNGSDLRARFVAFYPLVGLKWCTILLNEFVSEDMARREFASGGEMSTSRRRVDQLAKARTLLGKIVSEHPAPVESAWTQ